MSTPCDPTALLPHWTPPALRLPLLNDVRHQLRLAARGVESTVIEGTKGAGKTHAVRRALVEWEAEEAAREDFDPLRESCACGLWLDASDAQGSKTALLDLHTTLVGRGGTRMRQVYTPLDFIRVCAHELQQRNIRVLVVDEAQKINASNMDQLRQVIDLTQQHAHPFGILFVGTPPLRRTLAATGELGQRISGMITVARLELTDIETHLESLHPHLSLVRAELGTVGWRQLAQEVHQCSRGSLRRLVRIVEKAHALSLHAQQPITHDFVQLAMNRMAPEE